MQPLQHDWPIRDDTMCASLKFAVEWGNTHAEEAMTIGETATKLVQEDLKMDYVYDYMFHVVDEYSELESVVDKMFPLVNTWTFHVVKSLH
ncbi:hypothetical protein SLEP1_g2488 [Rubroshorea leprosula]|uniref:Glycosyl transferase CAP10 domain-containing protein n=1 Tax=Rubroshorea leprosula TaxID=152421 RepID=A0AAV5HSR1_9ROSI|nr:hypothetical protein SLEP1_g2488 [Rubroshorea leprosula]